ncbi:MAG TPA: GNAT family N-acetyltransferase [Acidimicrobiales bacterium]|nr:GNAT family N-acetyltransferase [Acidimicrobiales bacterium]
MGGTTGDALVDRADANCVEAWAAMAEAIDGGDVDRREGLVLVSSGSPLALFNVAFVTAPPGDPAGTIAAAGEFFGERRLPFLVRVREAWSAPLREPARAAGLAVAGDLPGMVMAPIPAPPPLPAGLDVEDAADDAAVDAHLRLVCEGFGVPAHLMEGALTLDTVRRGFHLLIGRRHGRPVATSAWFVHQGMVGVYNVSTLPPYRREGLGAAMTWAAVRAGLDRGCDSATLQASAMGYPVYEAMGFRLDLPYSQWEGSPGYA